MPRPMKTGGVRQAASGRRAAKARSAPRPFFARRPALSGGPSPPHPGPAPCAFCPSGAAMPRRRALPGRHSRYRNETARKKGWQKRFSPAFPFLCKRAISP